MADISRLVLDSRSLVTSLRLLDPKLYKPEPLPAGTTASEVTLGPKDLPGLVVNAALAVCGFGDATTAADAPTVLWRLGASDLLISPAGVRTQLADGIVALSVPVRSDQSGDTWVHMSFFVGSPDRPAGLVAATEPRPRGPSSVVDVWAERLVAFGWRIVIELATHIAAESGRDEDGAPLLPVALAASPAGLTVLPMARHDMDRADK